MGIGSEAELVKQLGILQARIQKTKQKIAAANVSEDVTVTEVLLFLKHVLLIH